MNTIDILIVWVILDIIITCHYSSLTTRYGKEGAIESSSSGVAILGIILQVGVIALLWGEEAWWYPIIIHYLLIAPIIRGIYNV